MQQGNDLAEATDKAGNDKGQLVVTALSRGLEILRCFGLENHALGTSEIARMCQLPQPTVWRLCNTLRQANFLMATADGAKLRLGPAALLLGQVAAESLPIGEIGRARMQVLADRYKAGIGLAVPDHLEMGLIQRCQGDAPLVLSLRIGSRVDMAGSTYGWAYLAALPEQERIRLLTELEIKQAGAFKLLANHLDEVLEHYERYGFVLNPGWFRDSISSAAVAIRDASGQPKYTVSIGALSSTMTPDLLRNEVGPHMLDLAQWLSGALPT